MTLPTSSKPVRVSVAVSSETFEDFRRLAEVEGRSLSAVMGEWLVEVREAVNVRTDMLTSMKGGMRQVLAQAAASAATPYAQASQAVNRAASSAASAAKSSRASGAAADCGAQPIPPRPVIRGGKSLQGKAQTELKFPLSPAKVQAYADSNGVVPRKAKS